MKVLVAGAGGFIGSTVVSRLSKQGYEITRLVRRDAGLGEVRWDPDCGMIDATGLEGFDGVVHVASMSWPTRWTAKAKQSMRANRLATNRLLAESLARCEHKPQVLICASGMGYYPSSGDTVLTENSPAGTSFLSKLQQDGEAATDPASKVGIRVVNLRIPPVLGGPALQRLGFRAGNGQQWMSWVSRDELASIIEFVLNTQALVGPVNPVSPNPLRNAEFTKIASRVFGSKPGIPFPAFLMRLMLGEMADELILASRRIEPCKLLDAGYRFRFPDLEATLRHEIDLKGNT
jgi:uncharacterized protein (TIGR01777 family)